MVTKANYLPSPPGAPSYPGRSATNDNVPSSASTQRRLVSRLMTERSPRSIRDTRFWFTPIASASCTCIMTLSVRVSRSAYASMWALVAARACSILTSVMFLLARSTFRSVIVPPQDVSESSCYGRCRCLYCKPLGCLNDALWWL